MFFFPLSPFPPPTLRHVPLFPFLSVMAAGVMEGGRGSGPIRREGKGKGKGKEACPRFSSPLFVLGRESKGRRRRRRPLRQEGRKEGGHQRRCFLKTGSVNIATAGVSYVRTYWVGAHSTHKTASAASFCSLCAIG